MTPDYASPEQLNGTTETTATDIYSLGVLLYQLLTGHTPYQLKNRSAQEIFDKICNAEPRRPSTVVRSARGGTLHPRRKLCSGLRNAKPERLVRQLAGDLDNILLLALRKEPQRRYASVEQFASDIRRHLDQVPVLARPDTLRYRASKFVRRNTAAVNGGLAIRPRTAGRHCGDFVGGAHRQGAARTRGDSGSTTFANWPTP